MRKNTSNRTSENTAAIKQCNVKCLSVDYRDEVRALANVSPRVYIMPARHLSFLF